MMLKKIVLISLLAIGLFLAPRKGFCQESNQSVLTDTTKTEKIIEPVELSNIGTQTESTLNTIREIRNRIKSISSDHKSDSLMLMRLKDVEDFRKEHDVEEIAQMNLRRTESLKLEVNQLRAQLENWRNLYSTKSANVTEMKENILEVKIKWEKTLNLERKEALPNQISERIQTNLKEINSLDKEISELNNALLTKQDELTSALLALDEVLNILNENEQRYRTKIFIDDSPPIWEMFSAERDSIPFGQEISLIIKGHNNNNKLYLENNRDLIIYHVAFFLVLLLLMYYLKNEVAKWSEEKKHDAVKLSLHVISKPFSSSLLVTLLVANLIYSEAPSDFINYFYAILVWPILTILPGLIPSVPKKYFYYVGAFFVFSQVAEYFSDLVYLNRLIFIIIDLITVALIISLYIEKDKLRDKSPNIQWNFFWMVARITAFFLVIASIANIFGNTSLGKILTQGSLTMIYGGVIIYASALTVRSLFALIIQQEHISQLNMIKNYADDVKKRIFGIVRWAAVFYWLYLTLSGYLIFDPILDWLTSVLSKQWEVGSVALSIGQILAFFITLWIALALSKFIRFILQDEILTHFEMPRGVPGAISMLVRLILITIGFILAFGAAKIDISNIAIIFGALGVGIGFGLQNIFNNLVSGLILAFERPVQVGDIIQIASLNLMGEVKEIGIRASIVRTFEGAEVIVPNGNLISNEMINWTLSDKRRRQEIVVGVAYGTDTNKVLEILNRVVAEADNVLKNPAPFIIFLGFGESSLDFRVLFWTHFDQGLSTKSAIGIAIDEAFKKEGIEIPFPQRDLHLRSVSDTVNLQQEKKQSRTHATQVNQKAVASSRAKKNK